MRAGVDRVESVWPLSSSKPGYAGFMRITGILMWAILLWIAYTAFRF